MINGSCTIVILSPEYVSAYCLDVFGALAVSFPGRHFGVKGICKISQQIKAMTSSFQKTCDYHP